MAEENTQSGLCEICMIKARKRFGQNFLCDQNVVRRIVSAIAPQKGQNIVEIGPGLGALTGSVLAIVGSMHAVEIDRDLIPELIDSCQASGDLVVHQADALEFDFCSLVEGNNKLRVVGNLPYNISSPLLFHLLEQISCIIDMHFMLQKEVVDRIVATPGVKNYGRLSVMLQYFCVCEKLFEVSPQSFRPAPKVDSAILRLVPHAKILTPAHDVKNLELVVKTAFNQRRKTLANSLKTLLTAAQMQAVDVDAGMRPERLTVEQFVKLANCL